MSSSGLTLFAVALTALTLQMQPGLAAGAAPTAKGGDEIPVVTMTWPEYVDAFAETDPTGVERALIEAAKSGDSEARAELAIQSLSGRYRYFRYKQATVEVLKLRAAGNARAADHYAFHWLLGKHPDADFRMSKVNAYLAAREALKLKPNSHIRNALPTVQGLSGIKSLDVIFRYREHKDLMTDALTCAISTEESKGVSLHMDTKGVYLKGTPSLDARQYQEMGVRVDEGELFRGQLPDSLAMYNKFGKALTTLYSTGGITHDEMKREIAEKTPLLSTDAVYIAYVNTPEFDRLLGQMATGARLRTRGIKHGGESVITEVDMTVDLGGDIGPANLFDLVGYLYLDCVYQLMSKPTK